MKGPSELDFQMSTEDQFALAQMQTVIGGLDRRAHDELKELALQLAQAWIMQRAACRGMVMRAAEEMAAPFLNECAASAPAEKGPAAPPG